MVHMLFVYKLLCVFKVKYYCYSLKLLFFVIEKIIEVLPIFCIKGLQVTSTYVIGVKSLADK